LGVLPKIDLLAEQQPGVEIFQRDSGTGERLDQRLLDGGQRIAAQVGFDAPGGERDGARCQSVRNFASIPRRVARPSRLSRPDRR
jgi:hypothetical protein